MIDCFEIWSKIHFLKKIIFMLFFLLLEKVTPDHGTKSHTDQIHPLATNVLKPVCSDT